MTPLITALHMGGRGFGFGWLILIPIVLLLAGLLAWWLLRGRRRSASTAAAAAAQSAPQDAAATILAERFARGEIDSNEYMHRVSVLRGVPERADEEPVAEPTIVLPETVATEPATPDNNK